MSQLHSRSSRGNSDSNKLIDIEKWVDYKKFLGAGNILG